MVRPSPSLRSWERPSRTVRRARPRNTARLIWSRTKELPTMKKLSDKLNNDQLKESLKEADELTMDFEEGDNALLTAFASIEALHQLAILFVDTAAIATQQHIGSRWVSL